MGKLQQSQEAERFLNHKKSDKSYKYYTRIQTIFHCGTPLAFLTTATGNATHGALLAQPINTIIKGLTP
jgi:hypothetical protein